MRVHEINFSEERHVKLTAYIQEVGGEFGFDKRPGILILPGGAYAMCSDREADPVAMPYLKAGYQAFILRYTVKQYGGWPNPLNDYEEAMEFIKQKAEEWHVQSDKIAIVGFSAGGHLAACAATIAKNRPAAAILVYPAILKDIVDMCQPGMPYPAEHVSVDTCPCFVVSARDDSIVPIQNTVKFVDALSNRGIAFESYVYSYGKHGFSTAEEYLIGDTACSRLSRWVLDSIEWLEEVMGRFTMQGFTEPLYPAVLYADGDKMLSVLCTIGHIRNQKNEVKKLLENLFEAIKMMAKERNISEDGIYVALKSVTVKEMLQMLNTSADIILEIDTMLRQIPNEHKKD